MGSRNIMVGTGVALAGLGGLAAAALTLGSPQAATQSRPVSQQVETQTVVERSVEHRVRRAKPKPARRRQAQAATSAAPAPTPVVQPARVPIASTSEPSDGSGRNGGPGSDDSGEHESGQPENEVENEVEHADEHEFEAEHDEAEFEDD